MSKLTTTLSGYWNKIQATLFPCLVEELDPLTEKQQQLVTVLELIRIEQFVGDSYGCVGRPKKERHAMARAFVAKMVYNIDHTVALIDRLKSDKNLRRICGWEFLSHIPSESSFSRAFEEFAVSGLPQRAHETLIRKTVGGEVISHNSRDSTAIEAREKAARNSPSKMEIEKELTLTNGREQGEVKEKPKMKRGRPGKGEERIQSAEPTRVQKQLNMTLSEMLNDLPQQCDKGGKKDSKGNTMYWVGYKLHMDTIDGGIPVSALITSASVHDSQVAIPLATITASRITNCYDLMDAGYDLSEIKEHSRSLGHVPLIDCNPRRNKALKEELESEALARNHLNFKYPEARRYNERSAAERANSRLKDEFGACKLRVRGHMKVACHLMFGVLVLAADQIMKLVR